MNSFSLMRKAANMSQLNVANQLGIAQSTVAMWESGQSKPRADVLIKLAEIFDCTVDELLGIEKTPAEKQA